MPIARHGAAAALALLCSAAAPAADLQRAEELVQGRCFVCHGADGESSTPAFPRLAGQHATYIARQLADYQSGRRRNAAMQSVVQDLSTADLGALGLWFESRPTHAHAVAETGLAQAGRQVYEQGHAPSGLAACASCHGPAAQGTATLPRLAGQHAQYIERQLRAFQRRERSNDNAVMHAVASKLDEQQLQAVASYLSGLK